MSKTAQQDITYVPIESITPYENNPRRIGQQAINAVATSLERFGWQQPIIVDKQNVIIVGHTRRMAALQLGMTEVPVMVADLPEEKANEYRLVDNRVGEYSTWDHEALVLEIREFDSELLETFFPEVDLEVEMVSSATGPSQRELDWAEEKVSTIDEIAETSAHLTGVECPSCKEQFKVRTRSLPGMDPKTIEGMSGASV